MPQRIWREARAMCVTTLIGIARWELSKSFPECSDLLERARVAVLAACKSESLTGSVWFSISRHMTTASARRYLERMLKLLPTCWLVVHPETRIPAFVGPSDAQQKRLQYEAVALANNRPLVFSAPIMIHTAAEPAGAIA
ncbi:hypothetical protein [Paraburkholderia sp. J8-2]|uniref:hypothetical protein n=1 Tax=Paraburkholderia sp. J8-2 TaxID=2805440 RepID=UPI002AB767BA|nr:hypothetical protein [Paraburkholderia sp. J8-2]